MIILLLLFENKIILFKKQYKKEQLGHLFQEELHIHILKILV